MAAGTRIDSPGVCAYCPLDGWLQVAPEWAQGYVTGEYVGDGTCGSDHPTVIDVGFEAKIIFISKLKGQNNAQSAFLISDCIYGTSFTGSRVNHLYCSWSLNKVSFYSSISNGAVEQMNESGAAYSYIAWR